MKRNLILSLCLIGFTAISFAQKKELTLAQSVSGQYREFAPERMDFFQWIPDSDDYSYLKGYVILRKGNAKSGEESDLLNIGELNQALGSKLNWFSGFQWKDKNTFIVSGGGKYYAYNVTEKKGREILELEKEAENTDFQMNIEAVAYTVENNLYVRFSDDKKVDITQNNNREIVSGQTYARSEFGITKGIFWSPNGNFLAFAQKDEREVHDYPLLNINETPGELNSIKYPMAGQKSEKAKIGVYDFKRGYTAFIEPRSGADSYLTNVTWTPDEKHLIIAEVNRDQNHMWLNLYQAESGNFIKTLFEEKNDRWVEPEHPAFFPNESSSNFVWISERDGFNNLYYYDIEGKLISQLTNNKFVVKDILGARKKGTEIIFSATGENPLNTVYYSVDLKGQQRLLTPEEGTHSIEITKDGKWIFDAFSNHDIAYKAVLIDAKGKVKRIMKESKSALEDYQIGHAEIGHIKGKDRTQLYTRLIKPSNFDPNKKYPVLVYVYGGPHAQLITNSWLDGASLWMYWMAEQGYLVFTLDNRGSAERGFSFESGIHRQLGTLEIEDQMSGVDYLKSLPYVDANRLAVHGWSFGGFMTTSLMLRTPDVFQVGVAGGPVTDWKYYEIMYGERYMDRPEQNEDGYKQASLFTHAKNLKGDLLLIHGTVDDVVVMQHNLALVKKFIELGIQMDFFPYPMHKHNVYGKDRIHLMDKILHYVMDHNQ
ncbi:MAG: S9 family peptidase [Bacteroidetes bacterium]|nr:MAG: S9 family peptidase [Bacteroidota bacterium]